MIFYALVVIITTLLARLYAHVKGNNAKIIVYFLLVMFPAAISGFRGVGTDIRQYIFNANEIIAGTYDLVDYKSIFVQIKCPLIFIDKFWQLRFFCLRQHIYIRKMIKENIGFIIVSQF